MSKLTRFGSKFSQRLEEADETARKLQEQMRDPAFRAASLVDRKVEEIETSDKMAHHLSRALHKELGRGYLIKIAYHAAPDWYEVTATYIRGNREQSERNWLVRQEALAAHTRTVPEFLAWVRSVAAQIKMLFEPSARHTEDASGWIEATLQAPTKASIEAAIKNLVTLGFRWAGDDPAYDPITEEQAAIESIKRTLGDRLEP